MKKFKPCPQEEIDRCMNSYVEIEGKYYTIAQIVEMAKKGV